MAERVGRVLVLMALAPNLIPSIINDLVLQAQVLPIMMSVDLTLEIKAAPW